MPDDEVTTEPVVVKPPITTPLWLPDGSVRSILVLGVMVLVAGLLAYNKTVPEWLVAVITMMIKAYFDNRPGGWEMSGTQVLLFPTKDERSPHQTGEAFCMVCNHQWVAVAPLGIVWMECPECHATKGLMKFKTMRVDLPHWTCNCGNQFLHVVEQGYYCPNCGDWQQGF